MRESSSVGKFALLSPSVVVIYSAQTFKSGGFIRKAINLAMRVPRGTSSELALYSRQMCTARPTRRDALRRVQRAATRYGALRWGGGGDLEDSGAGCAPARRPPEGAGTDKGVGNIGSGVF